MDLKFPDSRAAIERIQARRKPLAVRRALEAPFHRDRLAGIDLDRLGDPEVWAQIPIMTKEELRAIPPDRFMDAFCIAPAADIAELWRSGGATGVPLFYPRTFEDLDHARRSFARVFAAAGVEAGEIVHDSFPLGIHPVGHQFARAAQSLGIGVNWCGGGNATPSRLQVELIQRLKPTAWLGMSSYALHLANLAEAEGIDLAAGSVRTVICSAETLSDAKRAKIATAWGADVYDSFGMTEVTMMGAEGRQRNGFHIWTDLCAIEVVDLATGEAIAPGEPGGLVVTPLFTNTATPFLRWSSGDIVSYHEPIDVDGPLAVFPVLRHAHRTVGFFKVRGINIDHAAFEDFVFAMPEVVDFKAELVSEQALETLRVSIEVARGGDAAAIAEAVSAATRTTFEVTPSVVVLDRGSLAAEFESSIKAPRFVDRRV